MVNLSTRLTRRRAKQWLETAEAVWRFQRDLWSEQQREEFRGLKARLTAAVSAKFVEAEIESAVRPLAAFLRAAGGSIYPRSFLAEYVDFIVVATIVVLGVRAFFVQPMEIPTNSMWPTYYGMTAENFLPVSTMPHLVKRAFRWLALGATRKEIDAPRDGQVSADFFLDINGLPHLVAQPAIGRAWWFFPKKASEYTLFVDDLPVTLQLPEDFHDLDDVFMATFFSATHSFSDQWRNEEAADRIRTSVMTTESHQRFRVYRLALGIRVKTGDPLICFDLLHGDMLFVDRFSYHFFKPKVGSAFVFETGKIPSIRALGRPDEYLIKRLVGEPGDQMEIREPILYRNGQPIEGADAFIKNANREVPYRGYFNLPEGAHHFLNAGETVTVPAHSFLALGDNSAISEDGRYWGFVPGSEVIGRPLFIYYPFTARWGLAK